MEKWSSRPSIALLENWLDSTHIVWERLSAMHYHIPVTRIFGSKVLECPHSSIWGMWCLEYPPPHWKDIVRDIGTLGLTWSRVPPSPPQWKLGQIEGLWISVGPEDTPPEMETWPDWGALDLTWSKKKMTWPDWGDAVSIPKIPSRFWYL